MDPNQPNYPPGLSPQLDPTLNQQPGLFQAGMSGYVFGQHEARLQATDMMAGYAAGTITGAGEAALRAGQMFGFAAFGLQGAATFRGAQASPLLRRSARLATAIDPFTGAGRLGYNIGSGFAAMPGAGATGMKIGSRIFRGARVMSGLALGTATMGASFAAQEALISAVGGMYQGHAARMNSGAMVNELMPSNIRFSQEGARSSGVSGMAEDFGMEFEEFRGLAQQLGQAGSFSGVGSIQEFKTQLRRSMMQLKEIARVTGSTLQEAGQMGTLLKQQGFSAGQLPGAAAAAVGMGQATGLGTMQMLQMGAVGAQYGAQTNIGSALGSSMMQQNLGAMEFAMQRGSFSNEMIQRMGGTSASATMQLVQGTMGQAGMMGTTVSQMMGYIAKKGTGEYSPPTVDKAKLERLLNGGVSREELAAVSQAQQVLGMSSAVQRAAMPQVGQALHATLSSGTSTQAEYLRKAELMGIQPDVALALREVERTRDTSNEAAAIQARNSALAGSTSEATGGMLGLSFDTGLNITGGFERLGAGISRGVSDAANALFPSERTYGGPTSAGRQGIFDLVSKEGASALDFDPSLLTNAPQRGEGSGFINFHKGAAEARREAIAREFAPLMTTTDQTGNVFGETTISTFRGSSSQINAAVRHRNDIQLTEDQRAKANFVFKSGGLDNIGALRGRLGTGFSNLSMITNQGFARDQVNAIAVAERLGRIDLNEARRLTRHVLDGTISGEDGMKIMEHKNFAHAAGQATGHSGLISSLVGADIGGVSGGGNLTSAGLQRAGDDAAATAVDSIRRTRPVTILGSRREGFESYTIQEQTAESIRQTQALGDMLSPENRSKTVGMLTRLRKEMTGAGALSFERAVDQLGLDPGKEGLLAIREFAEGGFTGLDELRRLEAQAQYLDISSPIAERLRGAARDSDFSSKEDFMLSELGMTSGGLKGFFGAREGLMKIGEKGTSHSQRSEIMASMIRSGVNSGDPGLSDEITKLHAQRGMGDVARIFQTVESLMKGDKVEGFEQKKRDLDETLTLLKGKGLLDPTIAGAAGQAAGQAGDRGLPPSLGSDLKQFSATVEGLANTVRQMQIDQGVIAPDGGPLEGYVEGESRILED